MDKFIEIQETLVINLPIGCANYKNIKQLSRITCDIIAKLPKPIKMKDVLDFILIDGTKYTGSGYEKQYGSNKVFVPHGQGSAVYPDRRIAVGYWINGYLNSYGGYCQTGFLNYAGIFSNGKFNGHGILDFEMDKNSKIKAIECSWYDNYACGNGVIMYTDGSKYIGMIHNLSRDGDGLLICPNNIAIRGKWTDGLMNGKFTYVSETGMQIECSYKNGTRSKRCTITHKDGSIYRGPCNRDFKPHGHGVIKYADKSIYRGFLVNGEKHGYGFHLMESGDYYNGFWECDKKHGRAIIYSKLRSTAIEYMFESDRIIAYTGRRHDY